MALNFNSFLDTSIPRVYFKNITVKSVPVQPPAIYGQPISDTYKNVALDIESFIVVDAEMERTIKDNKLLDVYYAVIANADPNFDTTLVSGKYYFDQFNSLVRESNGTTIPMLPTVSGKIPATDIYLKTVNVESFLSDSESDYDSDALFDSGVSEYNNLFFKNSQFTMYKYNFTMNCSVKNRDNLYLVAMFVAQEPDIVGNTKFFDPIRQLYGPVCAEVVMNKNMRIPSSGLTKYLTDSQTGLVWAGSSHSHQNNLMAGMLHTNAPHASLNSSQATNVYKILDAREEMERSITPSNDGLVIVREQGLIYDYIKDPIELSDPSGIVSEIGVIRY